MEKKQKKFAETQFPEEVIERMGEREAARTTLLNFDEVEFGKDNKLFVESTKKTMQSYEDRGLNIHTFRLRIKEDSSFASELILKAIKLGAVSFEIHITEPFVLPDEVFQYQTLTRLSLNACSIQRRKRRRKKEKTCCSDHKLSLNPCSIQRRKKEKTRCSDHKLSLNPCSIQRRKKEITCCSNLKSLKLSSLTVTGDVVRDLISRCPLIEELTLDGLKKPSKRTFPFDVGMLDKLHKLKYLRLERLDIGDSLSESFLWAKLACLKELVIIDFISFNADTDVRICSTSLERITIRSYKYKNMNAEFNVPNIQMFRLDGIDLLRLDLKPSTREWEAEVHISCSLYSKAKASWFSSLNQLAKMLGQSRLSLTILLCCWPGHGDEYWGDGLAIPALEDLKIMGCEAVSPCFLEALLWSCCPNFLTIKTRSVLGLEKGNMVGFPKLQSLPWKTLLDASKGDEEFVRFQLK